MQSFNLTDLTAQCEQARRPWLEFLRTESLSMGVYRLKAGELDLQQPHAEDEIYYVVSGKGQLEAGSEKAVVQPGSILFVPRRLPHRFVDITEDLVVLVFFAPPEGSQR